MKVNFKAQVNDLVEKLKVFFNERQHSYQTTFTGVHGEKVLADLAKFCKVHQSSISPKDDRLTYVYEGRREVFLRIQHQLKLSQDQIWDLYGRKDLE